MSFTQPASYPALAGGLPDRTDTILGGVFIALFALVLLYLRATIIAKHGRNMPWGYFCFAFCIMRIVALGLRVGSVSDTGLIISSQIVLGLGTVVLYPVNIQLSRRFLGQLHAPQYGRGMMWFSYITCFLVLPLLVMSVAATAISLSSKDPNQITAVRIVRGVASVGLMILAFLPTIIVLWALSIIPKGGPGNDTELEARYSTARGPTGFAQKSNDEAPHYPGEPNSGYGPPPATISASRTTAFFILVPSLLLTLELGIRTAQGIHVPIDNGDGTVTMAWYMSKAAFWVFIFGLEIITIVILAASNIVARFSNLPEQSKYSR